MLSQSGGRRHSAGLHGFPCPRPSLLPRRGVTWQLTEVSDVSAHEYQSGLVIHSKWDPDWLISKAFTPNWVWGRRVAAAGSGQVWARCDQNWKPDRKAADSKVALGGSLALPRSMCSPGGCREPRRGLGSSSGQEEAAPSLPAGWEQQQQLNSRGQWVSCLQPQSHSPRGQWLTQSRDLRYLGAQLEDPAALQAHL